MGEQGGRKRRISGGGAWHSGALGSQAVLKADPQGRGVPLRTSPGLCPLFADALAKTLPGRWDVMDTGEAELSAASIFG